MATNLVNKMTVMKHCKRLLTVVLTLCLSFAFACGGRGADTTGGTTGETPSVQPDGGNDETGETPPDEGDEDFAEEEEKEDVGKVNPDGSIELPERPA